ncbi:MAG TPA: hypothetical protein VGM25_12460 [Caulobacteraceae bacterium]|jgi:hypothetical protein
MSKAPPIPSEQQGRSPGHDDVSGRHERPGGATAHANENTAHQGQGANTRQNTHRSGKTQDR